MAAYFTHSISRPPGYYQTLHTRSSVDAQLEADHHSDRPKIGHTALSESEVDGGRVRGGASCSVAVQQVIQVLPTSTVYFATLHFGYRVELGMNTSLYGRCTGKRTLPGSGSASLHGQCSNKLISHFKTNQ